MLFDKVECFANTYKSGGLICKLPKKTRYICFNYLSLCKLWTQYFFKNFIIKSAWQVFNGREKYNVTNRSRWELITTYCVNFITSCSLFFLRKLFFVHYLKTVHCFLIKHLVKSWFLNLKAKSECFFMFEFHNNWISFSALIKYVSTLTKFLSAHHVYCIFESAYYVHKICFLH